MWQGVRVGLTRLDSGEPSAALVLCVNTQRDVEEGDGKER